MRLGRRRDQALPQAILRHGNAPSLGGGLKPIPAAGGWVRQRPRGNSPTRGSVPAGRWIRGRGVCPAVVRAGETGRASGRRLHNAMTTRFRKFDQVRGVLALPRSPGCCRCRAVARHAPDHHAGRGCRDGDGGHAAVHAETPCLARNCPWLPLHRRTYGGLRLRYHVACKSDAGQLAARRLRRCPDARGAAPGHLRRPGLLSLSVPFSG